MQVRAMVLIGGVMLVAAPAAQAGQATIGMDADRVDRLVYDGSSIAGGQSVTVTVAPDGRKVTIKLPGHNVRTLSPLCTGGAGTATCRGIPFSGITATLGSGADRWSITADAGLIFATSVTGGAGADTIAGGPEYNVIDGGPGADRITSAGRSSDLLHGGDGNDVITGSTTNGGVFGDAGDDRLAGGVQLEGGDGNDVLTGDGNHESLIGGAGNDQLDGRGGGDWFEPGTGTDTVLGGAGPGDTVAYPAHASAVTVTLDGVADDGAAGENDVLAGIENVDGTGDVPGDDLLVGDDGPNVLVDQNPGSSLFGRGGNDTVLLGAGLVDGGDGDDRLTLSVSGTVTGGAGADNIEAGTKYDPRYPEQATYGATAVDAGGGDDFIDLTTMGAVGDYDPDPQPDSVTCGGGIDTVEADAQDAIAPDCEIVTIR